MDIQAYIDSGVLEEYFLGQLDEGSSGKVVRLCSQYPELQRELAAIENSFDNYAMANGVVPAMHLKETIWATLDNLNKEKTIDLNNLPLINSYTNTEKWMGLVKPFIPNNFTEERVTHVLQDTANVFQMFVISKTDFENETHTDLLESFIILEGECECIVGDDVFRVSAGGYAAIPLHTPHTVRIISPYVIAIMQRVAV